MRVSRVLGCLLALAVLPTSALAQWQGPNPLKDTWLGIPFWQHPKGHGAKIPCTHLKQQHPGGHATANLPCAHMKVQHSAGHDGPNVPCAHVGPKHPGGHDTGKKSPCTHIVNFKAKHPGGHKIIAPCAHIGPEHPNGHAGPKVPCAHMVPEHPNGHPAPKAPCAHMVKQHPADHEGPSVPCNHILPVKRTVQDLGLIFYTDDKAFQTEAIATAQKLRKMGVELGSPRPLHLFHRPPANGKVSSDDPLWSHYNPGFHSIQVMKGPSGWKGTLHHEAGHATLGHTCVQIIGGGKHSLTSESKPGTAMSEGWGTFVALVIENDPNSASPIYKNLDYEAATTSSGAKLKKYSPNIEFLVSCFLWDLYDKNNDGVDNLAVSFRDIFQQFSPTMKTLPNGPIMPNLDDFVNRFSKNHPQHSHVASLLKTQNTTDPDRGRKKLPAGSRTRRPRRGGN